MSPRLLGTRCLSVGRDDAATNVALRVVETPTQLPNITGESSSTGELVDVGGIPRMHYADATTSLWYWVQDGRNVSMEFRPSIPGEEALIQSVRPVTGRQVAVSIAEGQLAARLLPEIASTNEGGLVQHAFGSNGRTQAVCIDQPVERCYFPVAPYSSLDPERAKLIVAGAPSPGDPVATGDAVFGWVPASLVDQLPPASP